MATTRTARSPMLFSRQRQLLALLDALGGSAGKVDFQKLLFLHCQELEHRAQGTAPYEFVPYKFGAFSFTSYADRKKLTERALLADVDHWQITDEGRARIGEDRDPALAAFVRTHRGLRGDALVADTYRRFPFFATRSEIADRLLAADPAALARIDAARATGAGPALMTVGYEGRSIERYLSTLLRAGVTMLCDVRRNPLSRKYGFSKGTLSQSCESVGVRYEHVPALGIASEQRRSLDTQADYDALFAEYERDWLPGQGEALARIRTWLDAGERVALTCYEASPEQCHRHCVAEALEGVIGHEVRAAHL